MKRIGRMMIAAVLLAALLFSFTAPVFAAKKAVNAQTLDIMDTRYWTAGNGVSKISRKTASGNPIITASAEGNTSSITFSSEFDSLDLSFARELILGLSVRGEGENFHVFTALKSESASYTHTQSVTSDSEIYIPLSRDIASSLSGISVTVSSEGTEAVSFANLVFVKADDNYTYSYIKSFSCTDIYSENEYKKSENGITVTAESSSANVSLVFTDTFKENENVLVWVTFSGTESGGIYAEAAFEDEDKEVSATPVQSITASGTYTFALKGGFDSCTVRFSSLPESTKEISITGGGIANMGELEDTVGTITSCRYTDGKLTVSGSLSNDASVKYNGSKLLLFAIPVHTLAAYDINAMEPVAQTSFSTKFTVSAQTDKTYAGYFYKVFLDTKDGLVPVSEAVAPDSASTPSTVTSPVSALHGADAADVFESNASSVILDVMHGNLVENENTPSALLYNYNKTYYFNNDYISELDDKINFFSSAGISVYLRVFSDSDGYNFDYSADSETSLSLMCAVMSFLSERYTAVNGYIMGVGANSHIPLLTPEYAHSKASLIAVFNECIRSKNPAACVVIPYSDGTNADPLLTCAMVNYYLSFYKAGTTVTMYETAKNESSAISYANRLSMISSVFGNSQGGCALFWKIPADLTADSIIDIYRRQCISGAALGMRFTALSVERADKTPAFYDSLKIMLDTENVIPASTSQFSAATEEMDFSGTYSLWDFTSSYDTAGWVSGGSFSSPVTSGGEGGERVLSAQSTQESQGAGVLIGRTDTMLDMSDTSARVTLSVMSDSSDFAEVSVIFGSGESRAEFSATVECNKKTDLICDMKGYSGAATVNYAALIIRSSGNSDARISKIELCSTALNSEQMKERFAPETEEEHHPLLYAVIIFTAAATVAVFSVLWKKQLSQKKERSDE